MEGHPLTPITSGTRPARSSAAKVANLFIDVFGPAGKSSRSAVGSSGLPLGVPVECEAIVELKSTN